MVDIQLVRDNPEKFKEAIAAKQKDPNIVDEVLNIHKQKLELLLQVETLRAKRNEISKLGKASEEGKKIKEQLKDLEPKLTEIEEKFKQALYKVPNLISEDTPIGKDENENKVIRSWGEPTKFDFEPKDHMALGIALGVINIKKAGDISGSRFGYLMGDIARMEFALVQFAFDTLTNVKTLKKILEPIDQDYSVKAFIPVIPPVMMKPEVMAKMARLEPKEERYYIPQADLYLIGSAEHTLGPLHMDETLRESDMPFRYVGFSTSFREEAGTYGKDTQGILRVHQFDKVEMESFTVAENSIKEQNFFVAIQEYLMQSLKLPYQVVQICSGDMGGPDYRQIDINTWLPGQNKYRETHTSDLMTDYQARRLNTKVQRSGKTEFVQMNDATAFAIGRTIIAIMENYQQEDGSIVIPEVLRKWMGKDKVESGR
ncbi:serine--tRNA ligase [Candidatus Woesebacteria bacterium RIFCSPHIGHO2_01_FULL_44_21]|uniref:Serine--tRNA ligase n=1 Tax=Candidatus Woesebacteria bacterium RIFCSPHIGHO2_01_FULL_44_21 TaxID=1802503 RepID=A0A1F7Z1F2_9BACT|nr:MAG: serine--tRNA ligase [Candidatus Woesebacteria bacterium RIFCSPHIGHO2_01_FULL_44_21]OGM69437.1 MAG: serine--tRNA ligase [Candidatus Woesebacteria bacterium RIFCSPLOWO2_01_FULL_44_24b]